ncbi:hypothetical protein ACO2RV_17040 [Ancylobacter sp. VNQ12]|uniref:hypothetical protein n=1 Tax=Ancylobacter sp. VNQ12 TaxID=3400920 RepID=UPI003C0A1C89
MKRDRTSWSTDQIVTLAMLAGAGGTAEDAAEIMRRSPGAIREAARRYSIPLAKRAAPSCAVGRRLVVIKLRAETMDALQPSAGAREIEVPELLERIAEAHAQGGAVLTDNVLDDGRQG